ncbi:MAG: protein phosphatase 2C domain-containing protein [Methanomicrobiales archaeon]|nr:protein phosphatase 2C domain-containing protein [Methanomicrobiales archaeon]
MEEEKGIRRQKIDNHLYAVSHPGGRDQNEDDFLAMVADGGWIIAVADGLGGHRAGEIASRCAIRTLTGTFSHDTGTGIDTRLRDAFRDAHEVIRNHARGEWLGMGTTLVAVHIGGSVATIANTGDSRAYVIRNGVMYRTRDHSVVRDLIDSGVITDEEARGHPMRNLLTAALGIDVRIDVDTITLEEGDIILLATDGFYDFISEEQMVQMLRHIPFPDNVEALLREVLPVTTDNVTLVLFQFPQRREM